MDEGTIDGSVQARIEAVLPEVVAIRRDIHAHPELGREERRTSALVAQKRLEWGIEAEESGMSALPYCAPRQRR
jgi:metal-dependent amidase/aminoacylase/carboxypeptidase family protein